MFNLTILSQAAILGFHPLHEKKLTHSRHTRQQQKNNMNTTTLKYERQVSRSYTDTAISRSPRASDIDELPWSKYAASAIWVHNKL